MATTYNKKKKVKGEGLSSPWEQIHHAMVAFFEEDPEITIGDIDENDDTGIYTMTVFSSSIEKFKALRKVLKKEYDFGNVTLKVNVDLDDKEYETNEVEDIETILQDNPLFKEMKCIKEAGATFNYCVFNKQVLQYFDDVLSDDQGFRSTLAQDIAEKIFATSQIMYCTSKVDINK